MSAAPPHPRRIVAIGEAMIELSALDLTQGRAVLDVAGDTLNTAIYLARLLGGAPFRIDYITCLGRDRLSEGMIARMVAEGLGIEGIQRHPTRLPGLYAIEVDAAGERSFCYWRSTSAARTLFEHGRGPDDLLSGADVVYLSGITLAVLSDAARAALIAACAKAKAAGRTVVFDSNYRPALWPDPAAAHDAMAAMWRATTLALPSSDDERVLHPGAQDDAILSRIAACGVPEIVLKRGAAGPLVSFDERTEALPVAPVADVVDSTAAGDSFNAGYLAGRLRGQGPMQAAQAAHELAARVLRHRGAILPR
ncbi:MAG: sugar kinase [Pseudomonadota bacterium]